MGSQNELNIGVGNWNSLGFFVAVANDLSLVSTEITLVFCVGASILT